MALVRAFEGWKNAEREGSAYEYCWRNFLSAQTLQAIHSLRKQFNYILTEAGLVHEDSALNNKLSHNQSLVRAIICSGLFPGIASVVVSLSPYASSQVSFILSQGFVEITVFSFFFHSKERLPCHSRRWMMAKFHFTR